LHIKGSQGTSLLDFPGRIASIIFTGGCNFRCRFCYNRDLISASVLPDLDTGDVLRAIELRRGFIEGVVVTGGEPSINRDLPDLLKEIKTIGLDVKLDTNGTHPEILEEIINNNLADYIAMDYKAPLEKLEAVICVRGAEERVAASARLLISSGADCEFRTTVHPKLVNLEDILESANEIEGAPAYYLQQFEPFSPLDPQLAESPRYGPEFFHEAERELQGRFPVFGIRNLQETVKV